MLFFLTLTQRCNLQCAYCGSSSNVDISSIDLEDLQGPADMSYKVSELLNLLQFDDLVICFYGGEPTLQISKIEKIINVLSPKENIQSPKENIKSAKENIKSAKEIKFVLQTNGILLDKITHLIDKFAAILISIDGRPEITNLYRNDKSDIDVYDTIINNVYNIRQQGYKGDLIARMTVAEHVDIYKDVTHLIKLGLFDHVHWQLDVLWDSPKYARWSDFISWRDDNYIKGIEKLINDFKETFIKSGYVKSGILPIAPFIGILNIMLHIDKQNMLPCKSGISSFNITTDGIITPCPISTELEHLTTIHRLNNNVSPDDVKKLACGLGDSCKRCNVYKICGGRCLYASKTNWWGEDGFDSVCFTVRHLVTQLEQYVLPIFKQAIDKGTITVEDLNYPSFNNSIEIIP